MSLLRLAGLIRWEPFSPVNGLVNGWHIRGRDVLSICPLAGQNGGIAVGAHYAISEGAILTMTKLFAKALAESGVTVNAIACGPVDSPAFHRLVQVNEIPEILKSIPVKTW